MNQYKNFTELIKRLNNRISSMSSGGPHTHPQSDIVGLVAALAGKASTSHGHAQSDITNLTTDLSNKQATLVSATNIKTINGSSILGSGDLTVSGGLAQFQIRQLTRR